METLLTWKKATYAPSQEKLWKVVKNLKPTKILKFKRYRAASWNSHHQNKFLEGSWNDDLALVVEVTPI